MNAADIITFIGKTESQYPGARVGFCARNLKNGQCLEYKASQKIEAASVIKVFLAYQFLFEKRELLDKELRVDAAQRDAAVGAGVLKLFSASEFILSYRDLLMLTLSISDNFATALILEAVGGISGFNRFVAGLPGLSCTQWISELTPQLFASGNLAFSSAADLASFAALLDARGGAAEQDFLRLFALEHEFYVDRLGRLLPLDGLMDGPSPIKYFGSKGGTFSRLGVTGDFAIVEYKGGQRIAIAALSEGFYSKNGRRNAHIDHPASLFLAELGELVCRYWA
ncbi:MAG: class A beta-lactamase-related serine hydrolase [Oligoflexia bacterium]|nr:class A beta-lactamase-related serine hydrolase [Oligoflexia bacterium]